ncbi:NAD-dependent deacylase [Congregicoccus parvus]|uniref:NAD-dependent deacylase n=1 Tax=Congregicoccus parvus TaxID=3081749 RepID=UPI003FA56F5B
MTIPEVVSRALVDAKRIVVLTGAGVSAESGVPTFRDAQTGLWARFRPEDLATPEAFARDPELVWRWYAWRRGLVRAVQPNAGHFALVEMERLPGGPSVTVITQNVDGLHARAGSRDVVDLHGSLFRFKCAGGCGPVDLDGPEREELPACLRCGAPVRPDIVWFGEALVWEDLERAEAASEACDLFLSIGTSGLVHPAAGLPRLAKAAGAMVVEVNPTETPLSARADAILRGPAGKALPALLAACRR